MAEGGSGEGPNRNRPHPHNLQGILRLAVEAGSASEEPPTSAPMSEERRAWLQEVLSEACKGGLDEVQQIKNCLAVLSSEEEEEEEEEGEEERDGDGEGAKEEALDLLSDLCENLDNAQEVKKDECDLQYRTEKIWNGNCVATLEMPFCSGFCSSMHYYSPSDSRLVSSCSCCSAGVTADLSVQTLCPDNSSSPIIITVPKTCSCRPCG